MGELKINTPIINDKAFTFLIKNCECQTGDDKQRIGFVSKWMNYEISFYSSDNNIVEAVIDDFGFLKGGVWNQCEATDNQFKKMGDVLNKKLIELDSTEHIYDDFNGDYYDYYGVNNAMFI